MTELLHHPNQHIWYDAGQLFMKVQRLCRADEYISDQDYRSQMLELLEMVEQHRPMFILMDLRSFLYSVSPEQQEWINSYILPGILQAGVQKGAFVLPADLIASLSVEQIYEGDVGVHLPVRMFGDYQKALDWLQVTEE